MYYPEELIEEVRTRNDIVEDLRLCAAAEKRKQLFRAVSVP